jgi:transcriptional regulator GlxA family with amidase domain
MNSGLTTSRESMSEPRHVGVLVFDEAEVLDVAGPFEVFSIAGRRSGLQPFTVSLIGIGRGTVAMRNGFMVEPKYSIHTVPHIDVLLIPGGYGTRRELDNHALLGWIRSRAAEAELLLSVCTGSLLLAKAGLLDGLAATTHHGALSLLRELAPSTRVDGRVRFIDNGKVITAAGVSAGVDMSLHVVERLLGEELAVEAAHYMEWHWDQNADELMDQGV